LDVDPTGFWSSGKLPPRFNGTSLIQSADTKYFTVILGRILPQTEPYCHASFLIEIRLPPEFPFKPPQVILLDPLYHPNIDEWSRHLCDCWYTGGSFVWTPKTSLKTIVEAVIRLIDDDPDSHSIHNYECSEEYRNDYQIFYKKALRFTLSFGRPRH
jgi:ubiquitin-protein ligase